MESNNIVKLPLMSKIGEPNIDGIIFDKDSFIKYINSESVDEIFKYGKGFPLISKISQYTFDLYYTFYPNSNDLIGRIIQCDTEYVTAEIYSKPYLDFIKSSALSYFRAGLLVTGKLKENSKNIFIIERIAAFKLLTKDRNSVLLTN